MNLYIRYFDSETLVTNVEDAIAFLSGISEIGMNDKIANDVRAYFESDNRFPKRYKVRSKIYFILIKTDKDTMQAFKDYRNSSATAEPETASAPADAPAADAAEAKPIISPLMALYAEREGWYEGSFDFKRVVTIPSTGKNEYRDTHFVACCKALSGIDCYNRIVDHLRSRVDSRSQFPSAKGKNFHFKYLGTYKYE